jgi:hypothetical protein
MNSWRAELKRAFDMMTAMQKMAIATIEVA